MKDKMNEFHDQLIDILEKLESLRSKHPDLFFGVLPEGEDIRMADALQAIKQAEEIASQAATQWEDAEHTL